MRYDKNGKFHYADGILKVINLCILEQIQNDNILNF